MVPSFPFLVLKPAAVAGVIGWVFGQLATLPVVVPEPIATKADLMPDQAGTQTDPEVKDRPAAKASDEDEQEIAAAQEDTEPDAPADPPFSFETVIAEAKALSARSYQAPPDPPAAAKALDYDAYRRIRFQERRADLQSSESFRVQYAPRGSLFSRAVDIYFVSDGTVSERPYDPKDFNFYDLPLSEEEKADLDFAGFRLLSPINAPGKFDEVLSFLGASYFRAIGAGDTYGTSARGLAIRTASPEGEEFPHFHRFWLEVPAQDATQLTVYALLDSPSVTGAFAFDVAPGFATIMDVQAVFFPRRDLENVGIAPLSSMFEFGSQDPLLRKRDYRPNVHDADGLAIRLANGERVWRPLVNPQNVEISSFAEKTPLSFGLEQRERTFSAFADDEAAYETRPSVTITPKGDWGSGRLMLVEIPTPNEFNDNIVAFWRPKTPWKKGERIDIAYRLHWGEALGPQPAIATVAKTRIGQEIGGDRPLIIVDFEAGDPALWANANPMVTTSNGSIVGLTHRLIPEEGLYRISFLLDKDDPRPAELRGVIQSGNRQVSETWLFRWTDL